MKTITLLLAAFGLAFASAQTAQDTYVFQPFGQVDSLDPVQAYDTASGVVIDNVYERLVGYVGDSVTDYEGLLATDWEISEDGTVYTYTLREGVTFHSGNPFTCADVEYSIKRALVVNPADAGVWFLAESFLGTEQNANDALGEDADDEAYADYWADIDGAVECLDDFTVQLNLVREDPTFFVKMMSNPASIVDREWAIEQGAWDGTEETWRDWVGVNLREEGLHEQMSGTGAYRLVDWDGATTVAQRFDDYWGEAASIENVIVESVEETATRILALQQGDADRILVDRAALSQLRDSPGVTIHENPEWVSTTVGMLFFNQAINPDNNPDIGSGALDGSGVPADFFSDVNVRQAFAYSFDQDAFIEQVLQGEGQELTMALPPSFLGYDPEIPVYTLDPERAEEHFAQAWDGQLLDNGFEITLTFNSGNEIRRIALEILKENIEFLNPNFVVNVRSLSWPEFLSNTDQGRGTVFALGWAPSYADSDYFLHAIYHSQGFYAARTNYVNPEVDALIDAARETADADERAELYRQVGQLVYEDMPLLPYPAPTEFIVTRDNIEGVYLNPMYGAQFLWKDISKG